MMIECLAKRGKNHRDHVPGSFVPMPVGNNKDPNWDGKTINYRFAPISTQANAPHICEVKEAAHIKRFLSIKQSFRPYLGDGKPMMVEHMAAEPLPVPPGGPVIPDDELSADPVSLAGLLEQHNAKEITLSVEALDDEDLAELVMLEVEGKKRKSVLDAIEKERKRRVKAEMPEVAKERNIADNTATESQPA